MGLYVCGMTQKHELIQQVADEKELVGINRFEFVMKCWEDSAFYQEIVNFVAKDVFQDIANQMFGIKDDD